MSRRVLLVDDDDAIREVGQMALEMVAGWKVDVAATGQEALDISRTAPPDAVLLDVMMPTMDGPTVVAALRADARTHDIPVVLLTAKVQPAERRRWEGLGVAGVLAKPFDPLRLADEVSDLLGWDS